MKSVSLDELEEFVKAYHPSDEWRESDETQKWLGWMLEHGCIDVFTDDGESIAALVCSRMSTSDKAQENFDINPDGDCLIIDLIVSAPEKRRSILNRVGMYLMLKHGMPESVHWRRVKNNPKTVVALHLASRLNLPTQ